MSSSGERAPSWAGVGDDLSQPSDRVTRPLGKLSAQHHAVQGRAVPETVLERRGEDGVLVGDVVGPTHEHVLLELTEVVGELLRDSGY
ncbi:MAG TPA: hypothetical protein VF174_13640 [Micromonosporaceae bacterium]